ncbi:uncharacterized protein EV154DRAFT_545475 [Mucor mucedo]|uniref:uncharacterized protein n=1 Tax=Mucor mucedo TaxID=29922 RepID=UPI00221F225B|nr:uncharacterized protein EV154DRAFT_545475 [Mucor mucedo]KAI7884153.1 hypothetical protein EV154DRAFT_545475 [Mucor mucedo]
MADQLAKGDGSITSYCIEPAETQKSKCAACEKVIPHKSLRVAEIYRSSKKIKKDKARHTWFHFKCWKVPEYLTRVPIEQFRGFKALNEKDKARVQKVIKSGVGSSYAQLLEKAKPVKTEEELEADKEEQAKKDKKKKEDDESMNMDMTEVLTGTQQKPAKKSSKKEKKSEEKPAKKEEKAALKPKTDKSNKVTKKAIKEVVATKTKEIKLPKADLLELENFAKEFSAFK